MKCYAAKKDIRSATKRKRKSAEIKEMSIIRFIYFALLCFGLVGFFPLFFNISFPNCPGIDVGLYISSLAFKNSNNNNKLCFFIHFVHYFELLCLVSSKKKRLRSEAKTQNTEKWMRRRAWKKVEIHNSHHNDEDEEMNSNAIWWR